MNKAIMVRANAGIPGSLSREVSRATVETVPAGDLAFTGYGMAGQLVSGKFVPGTPAGNGEYGIVVRQFPIQSGNASDGTPIPPSGTGAILDCLRRGYISVRLTGAAAAAIGAKVYADGTTGAISADATDNLAINATFTGPADAEGNVEIAYNI